MTVEIEDIYPLSPMQQGMLFHNLYAPEAGMYVERLRYTIHGALNAAAFEQAWRQVVARHPILRSAFIWEDVDEPLQVVLKGVELPLEAQDWRELPAAEQENRLRAYLDQILRRGFELSQAPLSRLSLIRVADDVYEFIWSYHHLLLDGWSVSLLLGELVSLYEALCLGETPRLEKIRPYRDYIAWLKRQDRAKAEAFWRTALAGFTTPTSFSVNGASGNGDGRQREYDELQIHLSKTMAGQLEALARQHRLTLNTVVQGAWALLLSRYSGEDDVVFGAVVSGRPPDLAGSESMVGMFINTLPVRVQVSPGASLLAWLQDLQVQQVEARQFEYNPLVKVQEWSDVPRGLPLFDSIVVFENATLGVRLGQQEGSPEIKYSVHYPTVTGYPLTVVVEPGPDGLGLGITYDRRRFEAETIRRLLDHFRTLLAGVVANPEQRISALPLLTDAERRQIVVDWNDTRTDFPQAQSRCLHHLFEAQAARTPRAAAVVFERAELSYDELNRRANRLAHYLRKIGVGPEVLVGISMERSLEMMVGILGVLKAGGAYVPLDPDYPADRLAYMLRDSQAPVLLAQEHLVGALPEHRAEVVCLDRLGAELERECAENPAPAATPESPAYVIYTSGSTGRPKGVVVPHRAVANHMLWLADHFALTERDRYLQKTPFSFDAAGTEFFAPLLTGGQLVLAKPGGHQDSAYLVNTMVERGVTILQLVPSLLRVLLDEPGFGRCQTLRRVICAGEALPAELLARFNELLPEAEPHNFYGPTEAAIDVTFWPHAHANGHAIVPIGRPIANTQIYLLDANLQPAPVGVPGELHIGGENLGRGYLNRPDLTAERFIPNPFGPAAGARLYKTGDLARYLPDGNIEFLGRIDHQVKVRGFRIELGEIEAALLQHEAVREAVVLARDEARTAGGDGLDRRLVAYLVADLEAAPSIKELRDFLKAKLPDYMVPSAFVLLEALPLTPNGKVDRRALPAPDSARPDLEEAFVAPRSPIEERIAEIWAQVLGVEKVGVHDDFFELGGDSILSIQVVGRANLAGLHFTPRQLFENPTIAELAQVVDVAPAIQAEQGPVTGSLPLTPVQHWFFERQLPEPEHYNHAILLEVRRRLDPARLEQAVGHLLRHHDALRLRFTPSEAGWQPSIAAPDGSVPFECIDLAQLPAGEQGAAIEAKAAGLQTSLDLAAGPLLRVALFDLGPERPARLLILIHHLAVDGVSWRILLEDLLAAYRQLDEGAPVQLPPKTTSFKHWAERLRAHAQTPALREELAYWTAGSRSEAAALPVDEPQGRAANTVASARTVSVSLTADETAALLQEVPAAYRTQINDVLLTALAQTLSPWVGARPVLVDLEGHGREALFEDVDVSRTVGWFTSMFPVLLDVGRAAGPGQALKSIKEQLRAIPNRGIGYGLLRYLSEDSAVAEQLRGLPEPEVSFNYLGQFDQMLPASSPFAPAPESVGPVHSPGGRRRRLLEIDGYVSGGRLQLDWAYSEKVHHRETIERLAGAYLAALRTLIDHCLSPEAGGYTPSDFPLAGLQASSLDRLAGNDRQIEDIYPLSPVQEGMLFHTLLAPESGVYITQVLYELQGLEVGVMERAWQEVIDRHPILRTAFVWKNLDQPLQIVRRRVDVPLSHEDWRGLAAGEQKARLEAFLTADQRRGFELSQAPLMRMTLFRVAEDAYRLVWSYHHLLLDGWSVPLLTKEFLGFYQAMAQGQALRLERSRPYRDYIEWLHAQDLSPAEAFWRRFLKGVAAPTALSVDRAAGGPADAGHHYTEQEHYLPEATTAALQFFARKHQLTQNTLVQGAWALLLRYYSGDEDVVFGATLSGRPTGLPGAESMIGLFINTLPVRARLPLAASVLPWLQEFQAQQAELRQHEYTPLNKVQGWSEVPQDAPLFETLVVFENFPIGGSHSFESEGQGLKFVNTDFIIRNNFPFTVRAVPGPQMLLKVLYDSDRFEGSIVTVMLQHLQTLLHSMATQPNLTLAELLETLAEVEREQQRKKEVEFKESRRQKLKQVRRKAVGETR